LTLDRANIVVVDEADRMADMGFMPAVRRILDQTAKKRQTLLFSATLDGDIAVLSRDYQHKPVRHEAGTIEPETVDARHHFWLVEHHDRVQHTADLVGASGRSIVFTRTRHGADRLARQLGKLGVEAVAMHGGRSQNQRNRALRAFSSGRADALIATDVAARGIHIDAVATVIHFDPPSDHKDYLHRSGRTARAGATGTVVSLVTGEQQRAVKRLQKDLDLKVPIGDPRLDDIRHGGHRIGRPKPAQRVEPVIEESGTTLETPAERPHTKPRRDSGNASSLYVANLPWSATERDVRSLFERYGSVHQTTIIKNGRTGRSKGFGFVEMPRPAAKRAVKALHGSRLDGRDLTVRVAKPRNHRG
ncbi:MAG: DEAD/DEAH box helicase, partial [Actinomycetota bacterium]